MVKTSLIAHYNQGGGLRSWIKYFKFYIIRLHNHFTSLLCKSCLFNFLFLFLRKTKKANLNRLRIFCKVKLQRLFTKMQLNKLEVSDGSYKNISAND